MLPEWLGTKVMMNYASGDHIKEQKLRAGADGGRNCPLLLSSLGTMSLPDAGSSVVGMIVVIILRKMSSTLEMYGKAAAR
jgi:hypothetical protein